MAKQCFDKCCCCCTLETGGYVIGWLNIIGGVLGFIGSIIMIVFAAGQLGGPNVGPALHTLLITTIIIFSIYLVYFVIYTVAGILLVLGTKRREHRKMIMMLVLMAIGIVMSFINLIIDPTVGAIVSSVIVALFQIYFFVCIFSLYAMVKNENEGKG